MVHINCTGNVSLARFVVQFFGINERDQLCYICARTPM